MGECGCASEVPEIIIKINNNCYIVIYLHRPCDYCGVGFDINIAKMSGEELKDYGLDHYKDIIKNINQLDENGESINIIGGADSFRNAAKELMTENAAEEFLDNVYELLIKSHYYYK